MDATGPIDSARRGAAGSSRRWLLLLAGALLVLLIAFEAPSGAGASSSPPAATSSGSATAVAAAKRRHRMGGRVRRAWPRGGGKPDTSLGRWLARQVGPRCPKRHRKRAHGAKRKRPTPCRRFRRQRRHRAKRASLSVATTGPGPDSNRVATIAAGTGTPLALTRSYQIPTDDPSHNRLLNWSWTYDSAVSAASFIATGDKTQAQQLLDQLAALQFTDGSIDIAFNVSTGQGAGMYRAGTVAWTGLAFTKFDRKYGLSTYRTAAKRAGDFLISLQGSNSLVRGAPNLSWFSTQHNLLAYFFLANLSLELYAAGDNTGATKYGTAAYNIGNAIIANLYLEDGSGKRFIQGLGDTVQPFDVQALGAMYLQSIDESSDASGVVTWAKSTRFLTTGRTIVKSTNVATYNNTYAASGPFSGYRPYAEASAPNVLWFEGTPMLRQAQASLGQSVSTIDGWISSWRAVTSGSGGAPLQANQTLANSAYGVEYHVWPAAAPAAWVLLAQGDVGFFTTLF